MDAGAHLDLDNGHHVVFLADVEELAQRAGGTGIGDAVAFAGQAGREHGFGGHLGNLGLGTSQALIAGVMAHDEGAVGSDADIAFQTPCPGVGSVDKGGTGIFHTPLRAAVAHDELCIHPQ